MRIALIALTRAVPPSLARCELTHIAREPIDWRRARDQHEAYEGVLRSLGCSVLRLPALAEHPDSVFVEDAAVVLDECAVITRPGAQSRRGEVASVAEALRAFRELRYIQAPATLDGGDVLRVGKRLYVGLSTRTTADGARELADAVAPYGYRVDCVTARDCLHLKTAVSALPDGRLLLDPSKVDGGAFGGAPGIAIHPEEHEGANVLFVNETVVCPASAPRTREALEENGYAVASVDASELAKAEGGLTCCSLLVSVRQQDDRRDSSPR